jgi:hypothetical protein
MEVEQGRYYNFFERILNAFNLTPEFLLLRAPYFNMSNLTTCDGNSVYSLL